MELTINKVAAGVVGLAMVAGLGFAFTASRAHAISLSELVELFIALEVIPSDKADEARAVLGGQEEDSSSTMTCNFTRNLTTGDTGADVMELQQFLNANGYTVAVSGAGSAGNETEYFGPATSGAVAAFQEAYAGSILTPLGLTAGTGYFGASTRAMANSLCTEETDTPDVPSVPSDDDDDDDDDSTSLGNDEGSIDAVDQSSADESSLDEGEEGGVLAFDVTIEGDVMINRLDVYTAMTSGAGSDDADDYFTRAFLMLDGEEIAEIDVDDFKQDDYDYVGADGDDYRLRFTGLDLAFEDGDEPEFQVGFEMLGSLDSADIDSGWTVALESIRYEDGSGWTDSWTDTSNPLNDVTEGFTFGAEEMAELRITEDSSSPDASVIRVDDGNDKTEDVTVFAFAIEERNGVDIEVDDLTVHITVGTYASTSAVVSSASIVYDGEVLDTATVPSTGTTTFENMNLDIDADDEAVLEVQLTFNGTNDGVRYTNGETVAVEFVSIDDARDAHGNDESDIDISGTPSSDTHQLMTSGIFAEIVSIDTDTKSNGTDDDTIGEFKFKVDITAFDEDYYVSTSSAVFDYDIFDSNGDAASGTPVAVVSSTATKTGGAYRIDDGDTETFTLTISLEPGVGDYYTAVLNSVDYGSAAATPTDQTAHTCAPAEDFESDPVYINA